MSSAHEFSFPRPVSPTKDSSKSNARMLRQFLRNLKSNAHPYSIITTSTALLTRSNSVSNNHDSARHHYVPQTPPSTSPGPRKHSGHRHRYSTSLSLDNIPRPLPVPPSPSSAEPFKLSAPLTLEDLPPNPKLWTPSQLCAYLSTALRVKSGESMQLPPQVARDIAVFVRESKITGKIFLRLDDAVLETYGVNKLWKSALLRASQTLRQNVLKGHIWGFDLERDQSGINFPPAGDDSAIPGDEDEDDDSTPHRRRRSISQPQTTRSRFKSAGGGSTIKSPPLFQTACLPMISYSANRFSTSPDAQSRHSHAGRHRHGRVKGMVDSFERSSSFDEGDPTSAKLLQEIKGMREMDLEQLRKLRRERSGSTSSISSGSFGSSHSPTSSSDDGSEPGVATSPVDSYNVSTITSSRPLPTPPPSAMEPSSSSHAFKEEEPSIEDLLAQQGEPEDVIGSHPNLASTFKTSNHSYAKSIGTFSISKGKGKAKKRGGVYAWEAEAEGPGKATAKRVPSQVPVPASMSSTSSAKDIFGNSEDTSGIIQEESTGSLGSGDNMEFAFPAVPTKTGEGSGTHTPSRPLPEIPLHPSLIPLLEPEDISFEGAEEPKEEETHEEMIRTSIAETTELLQGFKARLGEVERKVDVLEVEVKELEVANAAREERRAKRIAQAKAEEERKAQEEAEVAKATDESQTAFLAEWPPIVRKVLSGLFRFSPSSSSGPQPSSGQPRLFDPKYWKSSPNLDPQTLSQLPPYVLLVGLGVCAVVLRVVAKKLGGRR
ncbi:hypothetical protein BT96DRAFT_1011175 [Gymnopus androsaceus JB14]|uniref:Uncharacterized protein n=1 Tax=Gymnopus androsaceus JB14 TaxID=1447944 RepID=A0A6A4IL43_9AGAR|nr:hypothetical protein BT96DRAFT_1011175 [Gymnopus androsaceus JB14]